MPSSSHPILLPHAAESEALKLKWVMRRGKWVEAEYLLTRGPDGKLSDKPVPAPSDEAAA